MFIMPLLPCTHQTGHSSTDEKTSVKFSSLLTKCKLLYIEFERKQSTKQSWLKATTRNQFPSGSMGSSPTDCEPHILTTSLVRSCHLFELGLLQFFLLLNLLVCFWCGKLYYILLNCLGMQCIILQHFSAERIQVSIFFTTSNTEMRTTAAATLRIQAP